jgi:hypothetical protein
VLRAMLLGLDEADHILVLTMHHIILRWLRQSASLVRELGALYRP